MATEFERYQQLSQRRDAQQERDYYSNLLARRAEQVAEPEPDPLNPASGVGPVDAAMINLGRQSERMTLGVRDVYEGIKGLISKGTQYTPEREAIAEYNLQREQDMAPLNAERPVSSVMGQAMYYGGIPGAAVSTPARAIGSGAGTGLVDYGSTPAQDASGAMIGYGMGQKIGDMAESLLNTRPLPRATRDAQQAGFELTPAQRLGNPRGLELLERTLESYPFTATPMTQHKLNNQDLLNMQYARETGIDVKPGEKLTGDKVFDAFTENSRGYKKVLQGQEIFADPEFRQRLVEIASRDLDVPIKSPDIKNVVKNIHKGFVDGVIDGPKYQRFRSNLVQEMQNVKNSQTKSQPGYGDALGDLVYALDDLAERNLPDSELRALNRQFKLLKTGTEGATPPLDVDTGDLSAPKMRNKLNKKDNYGYKMGQDTSDLYDTIRATGQNKASIGSSGTAERMTMNQLLLGGGAGGYGLGTGDIITPTMATIAPWLATKAYTSRYNPMGRLDIDASPAKQVGARLGMSQEELLNWLLTE